MHESDTFYTPRLPQDDFDEDDEDLDLVMLEENEDMTEILHVDPVERRERIEESEDPDSALGEDTREEREDLDQES